VSLLSSALNGQTAQSVVIGLLCSDWSDLRWPSLLWLVYSVLIGQMAQWLVYSVLISQKAQSFVIGLPLVVHRLKKRPALHLVFLFEKPFHSDICHNREEKMIATSILCWLCLWNPFPVKLKYCTLCMFFCSRRDDCVLFIILRWLWALKKQ